MPGQPKRTSCIAAFSEPVSAHSAIVPSVWYAATAIITHGSVTLRDLPEMNAAAEASSTDFIIIAGSSGDGGIPNRRLLMTGDMTAVRRPAASPYLYAATSVKKYIGSHISPPCGMRWHICGSRMLPVTNNADRRYVLLSRKLNEHNGVVAVVSILLIALMTRCDYDGHEHYGVPHGALLTPPFLKLLMNVPISRYASSGESVAAVSCSTGHGPVPVRFMMCAVFSP